MVFIIFKNKLVTFINNKNLRQEYDKKAITLSLKYE